MVLCSSSAARAGYKYKEVSWTDHTVPSDVVDRLLTVLRAAGSLRYRRPDTWLPPVPAIGVEMTEPQTPPVLIYLPGLQSSPLNSGARVAELMAIKASTGPGTYAVKEVSASTDLLSQGRRIVRVGGEAVLDVYTLDYRPRLLRPRAAATGVRGAAWRLVLAVRYFVHSFLLVWGARARAKNAVARTQLIIGGLTVLLMWLAVILAAWAALATVFDWTEPIASGNLADAIALSLTSLATWVIVKARPAVDRMATLVEQLLDYAEDERHAASVAATVTSAIDSLLDENPDREVYLLGYSLGALVALDFLFPRASLHMPRVDARYVKALRRLVTIGCPVDFVRLYLPAYVAGREAQIADLPWTNIYIAADILGSNLADGDDHRATSTPGPDPGVSGPRLVSIAGVRPVSYRYTDETLTLLSRRGFLSHAGYWDEPGNENCLHLVMREVMPANYANAAEAGAGTG